MRLCRLAIIASLCLIAVGLPVSAQRRVDITPLFGYRSPMNIPITNESGQETGKAHLSGGGSFGLAVGIRYEETAVIEFRWTRQNTDTRVNGALVDTRLEQYYGDFTREFILEATRIARPFVMGSVGMTRLSWAGKSTSRFSFGLGGGVKLFPLRWMGLRIQAHWLPIWLNPDVQGFACGGGCVVVLGGRLVDQGEVSFGPVFSF